MEKIAFIGLGHMGFPMACNLLKQGYLVSAFDINPQSVKALEEKGAQAASNLHALSSHDIYITMLQTAEQVKSVCLSDHQGLFEIAPKDAVFIDCSSIDVASSRQIQHQAQELGFKTLDAPVSGGVLGAEQATLSFMVGGDERTLKACEPILKAMGKNIVHTGDEGTGQAAKICNNMILGISMAAVSEAFVLAKKLGLEQKKLFEVCQNASGQCWAMTSYCPVPDIIDKAPSNNQYQPGFSSAMMLKDLNLSQQAATNVGFNTPLGEKAQSLYQEFVESGGEGLDFSAIIQFLEQVKR